MRLNQDPLHLERFCADGATLPRELRKSRYYYLWNVYFTTSFRQTFSYTIRFGKQTRSTRVLPKCKMHTFDTYRPLCAQAATTS